MAVIDFVKYTSNGNNFVILDETRRRSLAEGQLSRFAFQATNSNFGVGSDNLLVVQLADRETLEEINAARNYWAKLPDTDDIDLIFRMFEPDGQEALCCGNGLMCIASYLYSTYGTTVCRILTEVPLANPNHVSIGTDEVRKRSWVNLGAPRRTPAELYLPASGDRAEANLHVVENLNVCFRKHDLAPFADASSMKLRGHLVFTGEPHLVVFPEDGFSLPALGASVFASSDPKVLAGSGVDKRTNFGTWLLHRIGYAINHCRRDRFPSGVNVNLAKLTARNDGIEYRCFERGINRETLACGTGALAVAFVSEHLGYLQTSAVEVLPHRCRWQEPNATITVLQGERGWSLNSAPRKLFDGAFADFSEGAALRAPQHPGADFEPDVALGRS